MWRSFRQWLRQLSPMARLHFWAAIVWVLSIIPTLIWLRASILWVIFISIYANVAGHWGCFQAARAEQKAGDTLDKKCEDR